MAYPDSADNLTSGVPADGIAAAHPRVGHVPARRPPPRPRRGGGNHRNPDRRRVHVLHADPDGVECEPDAGFGVVRDRVLQAARPQGVRLSGHHVRVVRRRGRHRVLRGAAAGAAGEPGPAHRHRVHSRLGRQSPAQRFARRRWLSRIWAASTSKAVLLVDNARVMGSSRGQPVGAAVPWTWSASDHILVNFDYEAAAAS